MVLKIIVAVVAFMVIMRIGIFFVRALGTDVKVPVEGELRQVNLRYQCTICGTEVKMTKAGEELPEAPRHCMEDMQLMSPVIE